jgi:hypothetical protein
MQRLTAAAANDAMWSFVDHKYPAGDFPEDFPGSLTVLYRDDYDTGRSHYQVVDGRGHGDGSGEWTPVGG